MGSIIMKATGTLKFYDAQKGFGYVATTEGDVRIAKDIVGHRAAELVDRADVEVAFIHVVHKGKPGFNATRIDSIVPPAPKPVAPARVTLLAIVERFDGKRKGWLVNIADAGFSEARAFLSPKVCERAGFIPDPDDILRVTVVDGQPSPYVTTFSFGEEVDAAWAAQMGVLHAEDGAAIDTNASFEADPLASLIEQHRLETMRDLGQAPAEVIEQPVEVPVVAGKPKVKKPKAVSAKSEPIKTPVAIDNALIVHADEAVPNCALAGLAALTKPNGAAVHAAT